MKPYEWMLKDTHQTEWIEKRGILLWLAFFFGGLGGGLYLVSLLFDSLWGMLIGWLVIIVAKGGTHFAYLGHPLRFWRGTLRPQTSWISRGFIFIIVFAIFGALQLIVSYWWPGIVAETGLKIVAGIAAFLTAIYTGFAMNRLTGVPFWNNGLLPILFVAYGILGGFGSILLIAAVADGMNIEAIETGTRLMIVVCAIILAVYLWSSTYTASAGKISVLDLLKGHSSLLFWGGVVISGLLIPGIITSYAYLAGELAMPLLIIGIVCELIGGLSVRYALLKEGIYNPLLPLYH